MFYSYATHEEVFSHAFNNVTPYSLEFLAIVEDFYWDVVNRAGAKPYSFENDAALFNYVLDVGIPFSHTFIAEINRVGGELVDELVAETSCY